MSTIGYKLKIHNAILQGKRIEFQSRYGDGRWVPCYAGLYDFLHGVIHTSWQDGSYRIAESTW